jgi:type VI secretion system protein ImpA
MENGDWTRNLARLIEPLSVERPCGENFEDTHTLAAFDAFRVFGHLLAYKDEPDWRKLLALALETLEKTKDFRVLAHLLAATLRTHTLQEALQLVPVMSAWLERYWNEVYPRLAADAVMSANALTAFADRVAVVDPLRRLPLVRHAQLGSFSVRDFESIAETRAAEGAPGSSLTKEQIQAMLGSADSQELASLNDLAAAAHKALRDTEQIMRERGGAGAVPVLDPLASVVGRIQQILGPYVKRTASSSRESEDVAKADTLTSATSRSRDQASRQEALDALDVAAEYFSAYEPTSPVSMLLRRARRIATMSFIQMLAEIAPEAVEHALRVTGRVDEPLQ